MIHIEECLYFSMLDVSRPIPNLKFNLVIRKNFSWMLSTCGIEVSSGQFIQSLPKLLATVNQVTTTLLCLNATQLCSGNGDGKFQDLLKNQCFLKSSCKSNHAFNFEPLMPYLRMYNSKCI